MRRLFSNKPKLKKLLLEGSVGALLKVVFDALLNGIAWVERLRDRGAMPLDATGLDQLTAIVKTFERPKEIRRLIKSLKRAYPNLHLIVADDSLKPGGHESVEIIKLPHNSGVSHGRRMALEKVTTPYTLLLDDDFIFNRKTQLADALRLMEAHPEIDIMGGRVVNLPEYKSHDYIGSALFPNSKEPRFAEGTKIGDLTVQHKVANFFIARTDRLRLVNWQDELTMTDHADFFTRAKGVLTTVYNPNFEILHAKNPFGRKSPELTKNVEQAQAVLLERYYGVSAESS